MRSVIISLLIASHANTWQYRCAAGRLCSRVLVVRHDRHHLNKEDIMGGDLSRVEYIRN